MVEKKLLWREWYSFFAGLRTDYPQFISIWCCFIRLGNKYVYLKKDRPNLTRREPQAARESSVTNGERVDAYGSFAVPRSLRLPASANQQC